MIVFWFNRVISRANGRDLTQSYYKSTKSKKQRDNIENATKNFDYTMTADRLRTVSWSNSSHPTGVVLSIWQMDKFDALQTAQINRRIGLQSKCRNRMKPIGIVLDSTKSKSDQRSHRFIAWYMAFTLLSLHNCPYALSVLYMSVIARAIGE